MSQRIYILGASGSGTSTLGRALADALSSQSFDTDDFYWQPTDPPFQLPRPVADRLRLMEEMMLPRRDWILSGSACGWCDPAAQRFTHVIFLRTESAVRLDRLKLREASRNGALIAPGGPLERQHDDFLDWAMSYDDADFTGRSLRQHEDWLTRVPCPVLRLDGDEPVEANVARICAVLSSRAAAE